MCSRRKVRLADHGLLEGSGVAGKVEAIELDVVRQGHGGAVDDHGRSIGAERLHLGESVCLVSEG